MLKPGRLSLKKQTVWSLLPILAITAVNLVSVPLFYRFLGAQMYALWFYVLTFTGAFGFMDLGLGVAVGRYIGVALGRKDLQAVREYWGTGNMLAVPLLAGMALIFAIVGVIFGPRWFNVDPSLVRLLRWSFVGGGAGLFFSYYSQFWLILSQAHLDFKFISVLRTSASFLQVIPAILLAWATHNSLVLIVWTAVVGALQLAIFIWHAKKSYSLRFNFSHANWRRAHEMAAYTAKTFATLLVNSFFGSADRLVLGRLAPPPIFANYSICANAGARIQGLGVAAMGPVFHHTSRAVGSGDHQSIADVYDEIFDFTFPWYVLISIWVWLWHPVLLRIWLGYQLGSAVGPIFVPVVIGCCLTAISNTSAAQLGSLNRVGTGLIFHLLTSIAIVAAVYLGWRANGAVGVAWGFLASRIGLVAQDLFVTRLIGAGGWLSTRTWKVLITQVTVGMIFFLTSMAWPEISLWQVVLALLHGGGIALWLLRHPARNFFLSMNAIRAQKGV